LSSMAPRPPSSLRLLQAFNHRAGSESNRYESGQPSGPSGRVHGPLGSSGKRARRLTSSASRQTDARISQTAGNCVFPWHRRRARGPRASRFTERAKRAGNNGVWIRAAQPPQPCSLQIERGDSGISTLPSAPSPSSPPSAYASLHQRWPQATMRCRPPSLPNRPHFDADSIDSAIPRS
jgi:hypothetical protein